MIIKALWAMFSLLLLATTTLAQNKEINTLHMGYHLPSFNNVSQKDVKISLNFWAKEIGAKTGLKLTNHFYKDINKLKKDLESGKLDSVNASLPKIASHFDINILADGFKPVIKGQENGIEMLLLVSKKSRYKSLKELRHKHILRLKNNDLETLYLNILFQKRFHKDAIEFFGKTTFVKKYTKAIMKLFFNKADAAVVSRQSFELATELNPQIAKKLKIIHHFTIQEDNGSFFRKEYSGRNVKRYQQIALDLDKNPRGKQILQVFKADYITHSSLDDIRHIKALQAEYQRLKKEK